MKISSVVYSSQARQDFLQNARYPTRHKMMQKHSACPPAPSEAGKGGFKDWYVTGLGQITCSKQTLHLHWTFH